MLKLDQVGVDLYRGEDLVVQSAEPGEAAQDHVGIGQRETGRGSLQVLHLHFNTLDGSKGLLLSRGEGVGVGDM